MPRAGWLALGALAGALTAHATVPDRLLLGVAGASVALTLVALVSRRTRLLLLGVGVALIVVRAAVAPAGEAEAAPGPSTAVADRKHTAVVVALGTPSGGHQRAVLELEPPAPPERVYAWLPRYPQVAPGDRVALEGALEPSPADSGFGEFLARSGIGHTVRSRTLERLGSDETPIAALEQLRRGAGELLARALPQPQAGLGAAVIIGLRDLVARDVSDDFRTAGLSHVVAISGWHVALVAGMVGALLAGFARRTRSLLLVATIAGYAVIAGGSPSVVRAALMAGTVVLLRESGRRGHASAALGLAVVAMLLIEPATVAEIGFQLSVAATAGLLRWSTPLAGWLRRHAPRATPSWLLETLAVSLAAQAATLPLVLLHFGRLSLVSPLANLLLAPLVGPAMLATALALLAGALAAVGLPGIILTPFMLGGAVVLGLMIAVAELAASLPFASLELEPPLDMLAAALAALAVLRLLLRRREAPLPERSDLGRLPERAPPTGRPSRRLALIASLVTTAVVVVLVVGERPDGRLHMTVLDVGQGDAILLEGPAGGRMLVDTGPDPERLLALLDARLPAWDRRLDVVAITHPHEDHVAGLALLLDRYRIGAVIEPGMIGTGAGDAAFRRRMAELGRQTSLVAAGDRLTLDAATIDVRWPLRGRVPLRPTNGGTDVNNVSLVLDLRFGEHRLLLTGDVEQDIDPRLLAAGLAADGAVDVLKVAHHGSGSATTDAFVSGLRPRVAVISAGWGNPYGHPSPATVARLRAAGAQLYRTDLDGSVTISTDGRQLVATAGGGRPRGPARRSELPADAGFCPIPGRAGRRVPGAAGRRRRPYNRRDGRAQPPASGTHPARARAARLAATPLGGSGRAGRLPCRAYRGARHGRRPAARRSGGAAA